MHAGTAVFVFAVSLVIYLLTAAPTVSFWDSGEFITTSVIMGIPHPPGAPLLSLVGRVMSVIPFYDFRGGGFGHIAYRVNLIGVLSASFSALLMYLIAVHLIRRIHPLSGKMRRDFPVFFAGAAAALTAAFSHQFWENAVEVETYMPSLLLSLLAFWLALRWEERKDDPHAVRFLFLAAFVLGLGNGVHLTVLLAAPAALLIVLAARPGHFLDARFWLALLPAAAVAALIQMYAGRGAFYFLMALLALAGPVMANIIARGDTARWKKTFAVALVCCSFFVIGYSVYPTIMVRAGKNPAVNEGAPDAWDRYQAYLDREQYGQGTTGTMLRGAFERQADFGYQFGYMYLRYLLEQFPKWGPSVPLTFTNDRSPDSPGQTVSLQDRTHVPILLWLVVLSGVAFHARRDPKRFGALLVWFLLTSAGLALYLNMQNPQVRERDYFFLGSFQAVMLWLGIGIFAALRAVQDYFERERPRHATVLTLAAALVLATIIPAAALTDPVEEGVSGWKLHNRSRDWIPLDYAVNILETCAPDAILFTNGDNDTYPLWYAREVMGVRRDVSIVNMSLLNAPWYIKQLRDGAPNVPISFSDEFIDARLVGDTLSSQRTRLWDAEPREVSMAGMTWKMPPNVIGTLPDGQRAGVLSVASIALADIIRTTNGSRPLYFAVTVSPDFMIGLFEHMSMEGVAFRLTKDRAPDNEYSIDAPALEKNLFSRYRYRGMADSTLYKSPDVRRMLRNYSLSFTRLSEQRLKESREADALRAAKESFRVYTPDPDIRMLLYTIFCDRGSRESLDLLIGDELRRLPRHDVRAATEIGMLFLQFEMPDAAVRVFRELSATHGNDPEVWRVYTAALFQAGDYRGALDAADRLRKLAPGDSQAEEIRRIIERKLAGPASADTLTSKDTP
ncbi:MAG: protein O-mannosyl-transferase family [Candidatus Latescibacterota bacterium]